MDPEHTQTAESTQRAGVPAFSPFQSQAGAAAPIVQDTLGAQDAYAQAGWSWGGFMMGPMFLIAVRKYVYLWIYILLFIPFVNLIAQIGTMIFLGIKGREMAAESKTFETRDQYVGFMKAVDHAGKIMFFIALAFIAIILLFGSLLFGAMFAGFAGSALSNPDKFDSSRLDSRLQQMENKYE